MSRITRYRGDDRLVERTVTLSGVAQNISGWSAVLTIDARANPTDDTTEVEVVSGVVADASGGRFTFATDGTAVATTGRFFYSIRITDAGGKTSTFKGEWYVLENIGQD